MTKENSQVYQQWWFWVAVLFGSILIINGLISSGPQSPASNNTNVTQTQESQLSDGPTAVFGVGTHIVGTDIQPGTYRSSSNRICYWARLSGFSGELSDIITSGNHSPEIVTIGSSDAAFKSSGCGQWTLVGNTVPETPKTSFGDGTYQVGAHIQPGRYRADGNPESICYWARLSGFSHIVTEDVITSGNSPTLIDISNSDAGFTSFGCGNWQQSESE